MDLLSGGSGFTSQYFFNLFKWGIEPNGEQQQEQEQQEQEQQEQEQEQEQQERK